MKFVAAAALAVGISALAPISAEAATLIIESGFAADPNANSQRSFTLPSSGPVGQSFTSIDGILTRFGFQFNLLNANDPNTAFNFELRTGEGLTGTVLATTSFTLPTTINSRSPVLFEFDIAPTAVTVGQQYTALLNNSSLRYGLLLGPNNGSPRVDAYTGGQLVARAAPYTDCQTGGVCDVNLRVTGNTPVAAVPEPASWALMLAGFGAVGAALRRRRYRFDHAVS